MVEILEQPIRMLKNQRSIILRENIFIGLGPVVDVLKLFGGNLCFAKIKIFIKIVLMTLPAQNCKAKLFLSKKVLLNCPLHLKSSIFVVSVKGKCRFSSFQPKKFYNIHCAGIDLTSTTHGIVFSIGLG